MAITEALETLLSEQFTPAAAEKLRRIHATAEGFGANDEQQLYRTEGASFNSRCGRFAHILARQAQVADPVLLGALFLLPLSAASHGHPSLAEFEDECVLAQEIAALLEGVTVDTSIAAAIGALVYCLDAVRHAHMERQDPSSLLSNARRIHALLLPRAPQDRSMAALSTLLLRSLTQQQRLLQQRQQGS